MLKKIICTTLTMCCLIITLSTNVNAIQGIDVSEWQGDIDYSKAKSDGIEIVYIKASEGTDIEDPYFKINYNNAKKNGLKVGFYHFLIATTVEEARDEAEYFCSVISGTSADCRLAMDFEEFGDLTKGEINEIALAFLERVEEVSGKKVVVYSDEYNAKNTFSSELAEKYPLWIAVYDVSDPSSTGSWDEWIGFQYSDTGRVNGIDGTVDRDDFKEDILLTSDDTDSSKRIKSSIHDTNHYIYTVKRGDTLYSIAKEFGVSIESIVKLNDIKNRNLIYVGEKLRINK